jgi:DNA-binding transcriptional regulator YiaG
MNKLQRLQGAGLPNVYLENGFEVTGEGEERAIAIQNVGGLYAAIAEAICSSPATPTAAEFRFLRKRLSLSQEALGILLGKSGQAVAKWEKGETPVPTSDGVMTKLLWLSKCRPGMAVANAPLDTSAIAKEKYTFVHSPLGSWCESAPAPVLQRIYRHGSGSHHGSAFQASALISRGTTVVNENVILRAA